MAYSEYFNQSCQEYTQYSNSNNYCSTSHTDYGNYGNYSNIYKVIHGTYLGRYANCADEQCYQYVNTDWYIDSYGGSHYVPAGQYSGGGASPIYFNYTGGTGYSYFRPSGADTRYTAYYYQAMMYANTPTVCVVSGGYCNQAYGNGINACSTYYAYSNHVNYSNPSMDGAVSLNFSSPWTPTGLDNGILYIKDSIGAIKELRENIKVLDQHKWNTATIDLFADSVFTEDKIANNDKLKDEAVYDKFRTTLENLWLSIRGTSSQIPEKNDGDLITKTDFNLLKSKLETLATYSNYSNSKSYYK